MEGEFKVKVGEFEGPMEVLLNLIEERKLHISQVSLAAVADSFIEHLQALDGSRKGEIANFILIASTLMLIKSISLLPALQVTEEEKENIEDLERRLKLYQRFRELGEHVKGRFGQAVIFGREPSKEITPVFSPTAEISPAGILNAIRNVLNSLPKLGALPQVVVKKVISLEEAMGDLTRRIQSALRISFKQFVKDKAEKVNVIVSFLGMLELVKRGIIDVRQAVHFEDIEMETTDTGVPRYT